MTLKKKITLGSLALLLVGLTVLAIVRWEVWFGNPPEAPYVPKAEPTRVLLTFGDDGEMSRNVSWMCDTAIHEAHLELLPDGTDHPMCVKAEGEIFESRSGKAAYYVARLKQLQDGLCYRYRAVTNGKASPWYEFGVTDPAVKKDVSFLFFGDVQDSLNGVSNRYISKAWVQHPASDFVVFGGDLTERPTDAYWEETFRSIDGVAQTIPVLCATGNHEYLKYPIRKLERRFSLVFSYFLKSMEGENQVYTLRYGDVQLFLLDSNREWPYLAEQATWLRKKLAESTARWKVVVLHHPIYSIKSKTNDLLQRWEFASLLNENVDLVLQGHEHAYARMTQWEGGKRIPPIYTVSHCSPKFYRVQFDDRFDRFCTGTQIYQYIALHGDTLSMNAYDARTGKLYDRVDLVKGMHDHPTIIDRGKDIPEILDFTPRPGNKKDAAFAERIRAYKAKKGLKPQSVNRPL